MLLIGFARIGVIRGIEPPHRARVGKTIIGAAGNWRATDDEGMAATASSGIPLNVFHVSAVVNATVTRS
jgi:hypothetical protein